MDGGSFVMCEDLCGTPAPSFGGVEGVPGGHNSAWRWRRQRPFCCAPSVTANKPLAIKSSKLA